MATDPRVDAYLDALPDAPRAALQELRRTIQAAAPDAIETIAYDMPAFRSGRQFLVSYAAYTSHCSLFPASAGVQAALGEEVAPYVAGKGTLQFKATAPIPTDLVRRIVAIRLDETAARAAR
jgi:uncharacterized protein YdhG (YjbR/CyaY superfamily)